MNSAVSTLRSAHKPACVTQSNRSVSHQARLPNEPTGGAGNNRVVSTATASSGRWSRPAPKGSRSAPWPRRSGCHPPGCTRSWPVPTWNAVIAAFGELRAEGWSAPEDPDSDEDTDLDGRDHLADRLSDEVDWLRSARAGSGSSTGAAARRRSTCARPPTGRDQAVVAVDLARVAAVIDRITADVDELARARRV
jgi:hypothetical protein